MQGRALLPPPAVRDAAARGAAPGDAGGPGGSSGGARGGGRGGDAGHDPVSREQAAPRRAHALGRDPQVDSALAPPGRLARRLRRRRRRRAPAVPHRARHPHDTAPRRHVAPPPPLSLPPHRPPLYGADASRPRRLAERLAHATRERAFRGAWAGAPDLYPPPLVGADKRFAFRASPDAAGPRPTPAARDFVVPPATMRMPGAQRAVGEDMPVRVMSGRMAGGWKQPAGVLYVDAGGLAFIPTA